MSPLLPPLSCPSQLLPGSAACIVKFRSRYYGVVDRPSLDAFLAQVISPPLTLPHTSPLPNLSPLPPVSPPRARSPLPRPPPYTPASPAPVCSPAAQPAKYVKAVLEQAKRAPELIHMLRLQEHFPAASIQEIMRQGAQAAGRRSLLGPARSFQDSCEQTPLHFVEKNIDPSYEYSEWGLRRRALELANIRKKATHGTQTQQSAMRREAETQVYLPKDSQTMTGVSTGTAAPISRNYVAGLRGAPDAKMALVNLTIDPEVTIGKYR